MAEPAMPTLPRVGRSRPPRSCNSVVLPEPDAPTIATRSPAVTRMEAPRSTWSRTPPWMKSFARSFPSSTTGVEFAMGEVFPSIIAQGFRRQEPGGAPGRVKRREARQHEGHPADLQHVGELHVRRQIAHVVHACIEKLEAEELLESVHQPLQVDRERDSEQQAASDPEQPDQTALHHEHRQNAARR